MTIQSGHPPVRSYGRRGGRPLSASLKALTEAHLPALRLELPESGFLDLPAFFPEADRFALEIGFGGAEHLLERATREPANGFIGCEPFLEGVAKAVRGIAVAGLRNIRLWPDDVRLLLPALPAASLGICYILFPDPWPKRRQRKRRLVQPAFVDALARVLAPGAKVRFATDVADCAEEALLTFLSDARYQWTAERAADWNTPPSDHITTRYEAKRLGDMAPVWFEFVRVA